MNIQHEPPDGVARDHCTVLQRDAELGEQLRTTVAALKAVPTDLAAAEHVATLTALIDEGARGAAAVQVARNAVRAHIRGLLRAGRMAASEEAWRRPGSRA